MNQPKAISSRALARTWAYPRHDDFERPLRAAAEAWFAGKGYACQPKKPYILDSWDQWPQNLIDRRLEQYVAAERRLREPEGRGFPLHKYLHHGLSSQALALNLLGPLVTNRDLEPLAVAFRRAGVPWPGGAISAEFELEDRQLFHEDSGQPTSIDLAIRGDGAPLFVEVKFTEREFGACSVFTSGDCDGRNPARDHRLCYLHHIGRTYWPILESNGFLSGPLAATPFCPLSTSYQFFREVLFAVQKGGHFVLLHDARNPTFLSGGPDSPDGPRGLWPLLTGLVPEQLRERLHIVSMQQVVDAIRASERHDDWIGEFATKYGLSRS